MPKRLVAMAAALAAVSGGASAPPSPDIVIRVTEDARAPSASVLEARCGSLNLSVSAPYGDSVGSKGAQPVSLALNGRKLDLGGTGLADHVGLPGRLYKFFPLCTPDRTKLLVRYSSVHREAGQLQFMMGRFSVNSSGAVTFDGESRVKAEDLFLG
jgi:hypothetical protein